jgi:hypothetical protein
MNKMCISVDKMCISNSGLLWPDDNAFALLFQLFGGFNSVFECSILHISNWFLHLF